MNCKYLSVLLAEDMRKSDAYTINELKVPSQCLMERAAMEVAKHIASSVSQNAKVLVLCGFGNNGGDGFATARFLRDEFDIPSFICYVGKKDSSMNVDISKMSEECERQYNLALNSKVPVFYSEDIEKYINKFDLVVDAVFGIGLSRAVEGKIAETFRAVINAHKRVLAIDVPSGLDTDKGVALGQVLPADETIAIQNLKTCHVLYPGADFCGKLKVADIGVNLHPDVKPYAYIPNDTLLDEIFKCRERRTNKGSFGKLCLVCGSEGMSGAAYMSCKAALRSGIGLAYIVTNEANRVVMQALVPEAIVVTYKDEKDFGKIIPVINSADGFVIGCGLGKSETSYKLLKTVLDAVPSDINRPLVLDADGLNIMSEHNVLWDSAVFDRNSVIITPHPYEMSRISNIKCDEIVSSLVASAQNFAKEKNVTVVLKDAHTVIASKDDIPFVNISGNAGMATGGSGDVLAGILGGVLVQNFKKSNFENINTTEICAACTYLFGKAGDIAAKELGEISMLPTDIIEKIPFVLKKYSDTKTYLEKI